MEWLSENWVFLLVVVGMVAMHLAGAKTRIAMRARTASRTPLAADTGTNLIKETMT